MSIKISSRNAFSLRFSCRRLATWGMLALSTIPFCSLGATTFVISPSFHLRTAIPDPVVMEAGKTEEIAYSTRWETPEASSVRLLEQNPSGGTRALVSAAKTAEGVWQWTPAVPGNYVLTHEAGTTRTVRFRVDKKISVVFDACGGSPARQSRAYNVGQSFGTLPATPVLQGYSFQGWYTSASGGSRVVGGSVVPDGLTTLYAHWAKSQVVAFNANGGTCAVPEKTYLASGTYGTLPTATRNGYVFLGWFTKQVGGEQVAAAATVTTADTRTLYAHWTDKQVTTFNGNGGSPATKKTTNTIYSAYGTLPTPKWSGHVFLGWFTLPEGGNPVTAESQVTLAAARTLYAHWTDRQVTTFKGNGGTPETMITTNTMGVAYGTLPTPSRAGHAFLGWFTEAEGGSKVKGTDKATVATERTLWAHWTDRQVTTFDGNGGSPKSQKTTNTIAAAYGTLPTAQRAGHAFLGWYTDSEGGTRISANTPVKAVAARTFYAHWTDRQEATFKGNGGKPATQKTTNTIGSVFGTLPEVAWANHVFLGWYTEAEGGSRITTNSTVKTMAARTFWAHWTDRQVVTFKGNGGTPETKQTTSTMGKAYGTLPTPSRAGYAFLGWFTKAEGGTEVKGTDKATAATARTLYAHWTDRQVTTFKGNGGSPTSQKTTNTIAAVYGTLPTAQRAGHAFLGWYTDAEGGTRISTNTAVKAVAARTFYAHWTDQQVTTFDGNGGSPKSQKTTNTIAAAYGTLPTAQRAGHAFLGWYTDAEGGTRISTNTAVKAVAARTFYAHWTDRQEATFKGNGGKPATQKTTNTIGTVFGTLPEVAWANHVFLGWYTEAEGGSRITTNSTVKTMATRTFWAHWSDRQVVTFKGNGGTPETKKTTNTIGVAYGTLPTPSRAGHAFLGWFTKAEGGTEVKGTDKATAATARTLYAHWTDKQVTTFKGNGGSPTSQKTTNSIAAAYGTLPTAQRAGHAFLGWYTDAEGGTRISTNTAVKAVAARTFYAHWTDQQVATFKGNGGKPGTQKTTNTIGTAFGTLPEVAWANHVFLGWYTEAEGGSRITMNSTVKTMATRTFWAHWTDRQVVTFKGNGGTPETKQTTSTMGVAYGTLPTPSRAGHAFLGWFTKAEGGTAVKGTDKATAATARTLYAHWTDKQVTTFKGNGGSPASQKTTNTIAAAYGALPTAQRAGHAFLGWYTDTEGGTRISANTPVKAVAARTFYAHWTDQAVSTFKGNGGKPATQKTTNTIGAAFGTLPEAVWANHVFLGWYTEAEGGSRITTNSTVKTMATRTFYAHWSDRQVVTFKGNGGTPETKKTTNTMGVAYGTLPTPSRAGYAFLGWFTKAEGGTEVKVTNKTTAATVRTLYAHWTDKQVTTFDGNGGAPKRQKTTNTIAAAYGTLPTAQRAGHAFLGWYTDAEGGTRISANTMVKAIAARTFYAHWTAQAVTTFKGNGGKPATQKTTNTIGVVFGTLPEVAWSNHVFLGWYTEAEGGSRITTNSTVKTMATRTFYAHWSDRQVVTFKGNGGTPETAKTTNTIGVAYGTLPTPSRAGHAFLGWFTAAEGGTAVKRTDKATSATARTLWAHWTDQQVTTFDGNGGAPKSQKTTNTIAAAFGTLPTAQRVGHAFLGWYTEAEGGTRISTNTAVKAVATRTFYAHWTDKQVTTFKGNGGKPGTQKTTNTIGVVFGTLPEVAWADHVFLGWYTEAEGGSRITTNSTVKTMATRTFWAYWSDRQVVTFKGNGGTPETKKTTNTIGVAYGTLPTPSQSGQAFLGWFTKASGGIEVKGTDKVTATTARTLYAHWTDKQVTTFNGNEGSPKIQKTTNTIAAAFGTLPTAQRVGHAFLGWYTDAEGGTRISTNTPVKAVATRTFYAHWTDQAVTTFKGNGGKPGTQKTTNTIGMVFGTLPEVAWANHVFLGWYTEAEGGSRITTNSTVKTMATRTFYAHWKASKGLFEISAMEVDSAAASAPQQPRISHELTQTGYPFLIRFDAVAGSEYEIQWTPTLAAEWTPLGRWVADEDCEAEVPVSAPDGSSTGFFRVLAIEPQ